MNEKIKGGIGMKNFRDFMMEEDGMGVVEIILIIVILIFLCLFYFY